MKSETLQTRRSPISPDEISIDYLLSILWAKRAILFTIPSVIIAIALVYVLVAAKTYKAEATLQVKPRGPQILNITEIESRNPSMMEFKLFLGDIVSSLKTRQLFLRVIERMDLKNHPVFTKDKAPGEDPPSEDVMIKWLDYITKVNLRKDTLLIDLSVETGSRKLSVEVLNAILSEFFLLRKQRQLDITQQAYDYLIEESDRLKAKLDESEKKLYAFKKDSETFSFENENRNAELLKLTSITQSLATAKTNRLSLESNVKTLAKRYKSKHPKMIDAINAVENARKLEQDLETALSEQENLALGVEQKALDYRTIAHQVKTDRLLYEGVLQRIKETAVAKTLDQDLVQVLEPPYAKELPVWPKKKITVIIAAFFGAAIALAIAIALHFLDYSVHTPEMAERAFRSPMLGSLPEMGASVSANPLLFLAPRSSSHAESMRALKQVVEGQTPGTARTSLWTSINPGEGKTLLSLNYSGLLAQSGLRTLYIQANREDGGKSALLPELAETTGLFNYLDGKAPADDIIRPTGVDNLSVIPAGDASPLDGFSNGRWKALLEETGNRYDRIVIDGPSTNRSSDPLSISKTVSSVIMVIRSEKTPFRSVENTREIFDRVHAPVTGCILNGYQRFDEFNPMTELKNQASLAAKLSLKSAAFVIRRIPGANEKIQTLLEDRIKKNASRMKN